jgi:ribonuclease BN (tRNA processing enzyme)
MGNRVAAALALLSCATAVADEPPPPPPPLTVLVLGSGGPRPSKRASVGNLVLFEGQARLLVDAGPGTFVRAGESGVELSALDTVLLTHLHVDHSAELPAFVKARVLDASGPVRMRVLGPGGSALFPSTSVFVDGLFGARGLYRYLHDFGADLRVVGEDMPATLGAPSRTVKLDGGISVTAQAIHHGDTPAVAFRVELGGRSLVFAGDIDATGLASLQQLARGTDLLVVSCAVLDPPGSPPALYQRHSPPRRLGETAAAAGVKALLLTHLPPAVEAHQAEVLASVRKSFSGSVTFAEDGLRVDVVPAGPTAAQAGGCQSDSDCAPGQSCRQVQCKRAPCPPQCVSR